MRKTILAISVTAAIMASAGLGITYAQSPEVPIWIKQSMLFYGQGDVSDQEFLQMVKFLVDYGIVTVQDDDAEKIAALEAKVAVLEDAIAEKDARIQDLESVIKSAPSPDDDGTNLLDIGGKATVVIPEGWSDTSARDEYTGQMVYSITDDTTAYLDIPTSIGVTLNAYNGKDDLMKAYYETVYGHPIIARSGEGGLLSVEVEITEEEYTGDFYHNLYVAAPTFDLELMRVWGQDMAWIGPDGHTMYIYGNSAMPGAWKEQQTQDAFSLVYDSFTYR